MKDSTITASVDFEAPGVQHGFLKLPWSDDRSAWGSIMTPITVISGGAGPTALLTGANHGDEYEGPVALSRLATTLQATDVSGRVIVVPFFNFPAFKAGKRTSPIDGGNLNRLVPGKPDGSATERLADYFQRTMLPMADVVLDIHSGGKSLEILPFAATHILDDKQQQQACEDAMRAFGAPWSMLMLEMDPAGLYDTAAEAMGKIFVTTELGGGGTTRPSTIEIADTGIHNLLVHAGIKHGEVIERPTKLLDMPDARCFVVAESSGLLEPMVELGETVAEGQLIAQIWNTERSGELPQAIHASRDGVLASRHYPGLIATGDCVAVIALVTES